MTPPPQRPGASSSPAAQFSADGFWDLLRLVEEASGIALPDDKLYLALSRLHPMLRELRVPSLGALAQAARSDPRRELLGRIVDAVATHETSFFRDPEVFSLIREQFLPPLLGERGRARVWCAACATGQEPYSLAMALLEAGISVGTQGSQVQIVASDISSRAIAEAVAGSYDEFAVSRGLSSERLSHFFDPQEARRWQIRAGVRDAVQFRQANLLEAQHTLGEFDLVLVRNVLIYFGELTRSAVLAHIARITRPGGHLILGSSENPNAVPEGFVPVAHLNRPIFQKV